MPRLPHLFMKTLVAFLWLFGLEIVGPGHQGREHRDVEGSPGAWAQALVQAPDCSHIGNEQHSMEGALFIHNELNIHVIICTHPTALGKGFNLGWSLGWNLIWKAL